MLSGGKTEEGGIGKDSPEETVSCSLRDVLHLMLAAVAGHVNSTTSSEGELSYSFLRQAVGVNNLTAALPSLDPRRLFPSGVEVFRRGILELGVDAMLSFLASREILQITSTGKSIKASAPNDSGGGSLGATLSAAWRSVMGDSSKSTSIEKKTLIPSSPKSYTTLGSDMKCKYLDIFLR